MHVHVRVRVRVRVCVCVCVRRGKIKKQEEEGNIIGAYFIFAILFSINEKGVSYYLLYTPITPAIAAVMDSR